MGTGLARTASGLWDVASGEAFAPKGSPIPFPRLPAPSAAQQKAANRTDQIMSALETQHPGYNYGVKWPSEFLASLPLGEGAGAVAEKALPELPVAANLLTRALYRAPAAAARGAAYGVQQPGGTPATNATIGAVAGPLFEGGASLGGKALGMTAQGAQGLYRKFFPRALTQAELDSVLARRFADRGLPTSVAPRQTPPGVELPTAVHSGDPRLMALQAAERIGGTGTPFYEMAGANNAAIVNGLQRGLAPQADNGAISSAAHQLLQSAQERGRAAVRAAYQPFDAIKGGVYLDREPIESSLREAYNGLLPAHREILPAKVQEIIGREQPVERQIVPGSPQQMLDAARPLHLTNDVEDLGARLSDAIAGAKPGSPASRALMVMRDALNRGVEASRPVAGVTGGEPIEDATEMWARAKAANTGFRERFPQGTARDTEARQWLSRWLSGRRDPTKFLTEALVSPTRAQAAIDALKDSPAEQEQMRGLLRNGYVNRLLSATREGIPGTRTLNADALSRTRAQNSALERALLTPGERGTLDRYVEAAHANQRILQRLHTGSSETAALSNYGKEHDTSVMEELLKHGASAMHPAVGFLAHILPALARSPDNAGALQRTLTEALLNPSVYNRVAGAPQHIQAPIAKLLRGLAQPTRLAITRPAVFGVPRALGPAFSGAQ